MTEKSKLGAILVQSKLISNDDVDRALAEQKRSGKRFGEALIQLGIVEEEDVGWGLSNQLNVPFIRLTMDSVDSEAVKIVPEPLSRRHNLLPFLKIDNELTIVIDDPMNRRAIAEVEAVTGCKVNVCIGLPHEITHKIDEVYGTTSGPADDISELESDLFSEIERNKIANDFSGETFLRTLLDHTIQRNAYSIHFEPKAGRIHLRLRTESGIQPVGSISQGWFLVLGNRLKSLLDMMETAENFIEGFLSHQQKDRRFVFYTSIVKTPYGNSITLLNLTPRDFADSFDELPLSTDSREAILQIIGGRSGLVMIVGPGKIEKLKFIDLLLKKKHGDLKKTFVIGSMPWFTDSGYIQLKTQVEDKQHQLDRLKIAMSQDPDILYVEDAWNKQVLEYALQSAIPTTFVLTSLHFPDTLTALEYANESIDNKTMLTQALRGLIGVHIFRTLCPDCKVIDDNYAAQSRSLKIPRTKVEKKSIYKAVGCEKCHRRGYLGSRIVVETLHMDDKLSKSLKSGKKFSVIRAEIENKGHKTIEQQAQDLVLSGEIGIDDLKNVERR